MDVVRIVLSSEAVIMFQILCSGVNTRKLSYGILILAVLLGILVKDVGKKLVEQMGCVIEQARLIMMGNVLVMMIVFTLVMTVSCQSIQILEFVLACSINIVIKRILYVCNATIIVREKTVMSVPLNIRLLEKPAFVIHAKLMLIAKTVDSVSKMQLLLTFVNVKIITTNHFVKNANRGICFIKILVC